MTEFTGTERYHVVRRLGKGGMGAVYEVIDTHRDLTVALKTLNLSSAEGAENLKREFRAAAGIRHPNLITLYDLVITRERAFFTMEQVPGDDLATYVRPYGERLVTGPVEGPLPVGYDLNRLLAIMPQVLAGLDALHGAGFVHRDLKPANILATRDGVAKILDFGIAQAIQDNGLAEDESEAVGTPQYMSPEQAFGKRAGPEADLYALGCILFVALTGRYPFDSEDDIEILKAQAHSPPPRPREFVPQIPAPLERLCLDLLKKEPAQRPTAREAVQRLVSEMGARPPVWHQRRPPAEVPFVGREPELQAVVDAAVAVERGEPRAVLVGGDTGIGKSLVVQEALRLLRNRKTRWGHYSSRCYEREDMPYKAWDGIIESLASTLSRRKEAARELLPEGTAALARIFPVLQEVPVVAALSQPKSSDLRADRDRAFAALREILVRLARVRPLCLVFDDLQWADAESVELLRSLSTEVTDAPILLLATARTGEIREGHPLEPFLHDCAQGSNVRLEMRPFGKREVAELMKRISGQEVPLPLAERVLRESRGVPYLAAELARASAESSAPGSVAPDLTTLLRGRVARLSAEAGAALDCAAVVGGLATFKLLRAAVGIPSTKMLSALEELIEARLLREAYHPELDEVYDVYHNRVRELVYEQLPEERRRGMHHVVARGLEESLGSRRRARDLERLAEHWWSAGDAKRSLRYTVEAARQAEEKLAFGHAAELYGKAQARSGGVHIQALRERRAEALDLAGRYKEAAHEFGAAAREVDGLARARLVLRAAEADLKAGELARGTAGLEHVLAAVDGQNISKRSTSSILFSIVRHKWEGELRSLFVKPGKGEPPSPEEALRLDLYYRLAGYYFVFDIFRGAEYQEKLFARALRLKDPMWIARAYYGHGVFLSASFNERYMRQAKGFIQAGDEIVGAHEIQDLFTRYMGLAAWAVHHLCYNNWGETLRCFFEVEKHWDELGPRSFERVVAASYVARTEFYAGMLESADTRLRPEILRARERGDRYALAEFAWARMRVALYRGNLTRARAARDESLYLWPETPWSLQRLRMELAAAEISLAEQEHEAAIERLSRLLARAQETGLDYLRWDHGELSLLLARALCGAAARTEGEPRARLLDRATTALKSTFKLPRGLLYAAALRQRGVIALLRGRHQDALARTEEAVQLFRHVQGKVEEAAALLLRGRLRMECSVAGGEEDRARGEALLAALGAWDPAAREGGSWFWK